MVAKRKQLEKPNHYLIVVEDFSGEKFYLTYADSLKYYYVSRNLPMAEKFATKEDAVKAYVSFINRVSSRKNLWSEFRLKGIFA